MNKIKIKINEKIVISDLLYLGLMPNNVFIIKDGYLITYSNMVKSNLYKLYSYFKDHYKTFEGLSYNDQEVTTIIKDFMI